MESLRKQASKLREQVAKQQQAVIKHISGTGYEGSDTVVIDEIELQRHQQLDKLYKSTRSARVQKLLPITDFQKEVVKAAEIFTSLGYRKVEAGTKLSEECCKYGAENIDDSILAKAASIYGDARKHMEKEQEDLNRLLLSQSAATSAATVASRLKSAEENSSEKGSVVIGRLACRVSAFSLSDRRPTSLQLSSTSMSRFRVSRRALNWRIKGSLFLQLMEGFGTKWKGKWRDETIWDYRDGSRLNLRKSFQN
ncbi:hypothetical protein Cgig2_032911 [Carnegiea gigantea]|uniref:Uncharacterized protein n=1 Tax=Carnegiea gigantea TaxID=171969 RepID=A0A9Q1K0R4_9CARY|nr:hypothetical protein Cgig2_032911 [Carnegiea gigantea]